MSKSPEQLLASVMLPLAGQNAKTTVEVLMGALGSCLNAVVSSVEDKDQAEALIDEILADIRAAALAEPQLITLNVNDYANLQ